MNSSLIGKIEKAIQYAEERERAQFQGFTLAFRGDHDVHTVTYDQGLLRCTCNFFPNWYACSHTMAIERILAGMLKEPRPGRS